ncbi:hypothetical protein GCM10010123_22680 [Pilimelia anulata]|uniref:Uncharacterized protein n=1 Tax=Pilimelia anulata TaxID=53371 RepID=A0A8J3FCM6_9ACTN|nr:hypothetical protein [Pilimelia anulata]GGJ92313.1 hypothetical protein GCM10010123_22680 [Pilimelia anulata]
MTRPRKDTPEAVARTEAVAASPLGRLDSARRALADAERDQAAAGEAIAHLTEQLAVATARWDAAVARSAEIRADMPRLRSAAADDPEARGWLHDARFGQ